MYKMQHNSKIGCNKASQRSIAAQRYETIWHSRMDALWIAILPSTSSAHGPARNRQIVMTH